MDQSPNENSTETKDEFSADMLKIRHAIVWIIVSIVAMLALSGFYLFFAWNKYQHEAVAEAIMLAESLESVIYPDDVAKLSGDAGDL